MNKRLQSYYDYRMPLFIAEKLTELNYNPDRFVEWIGKFPNLYPAEKIYFRGLNKKSKTVALWTYYFIVFYLFCVAVVATLSPLVSLMALILTPLIAIGSMYTFVTFIHSTANSTKSAKAKLAGVKTNKKARKKQTDR